MKINYVTFILTFYNHRALEIEFWSKALSELQLSGHQVIVVNDNPNKKINQDVFPNIQIINNLENLGKFHSVIKSSKFWKNDFIKTLDPDDFISIENLNEASKFLKKGCINVSDACFIKKEIPKSTNQVTKIINKTKGKKMNSFGTAWTILPADKITNSEYIPKLRIDINEDQLLSQVCLSNGAGVNHIKTMYYLHKHENGVSNPKNAKKYIENLSNTIDEYFYIKKKFNFDNKSQWPNFPYYYSIIRKSKHTLPREKKRLNSLVYSYERKIDYSNHIKDNSKLVDKLNVVLISDKNQFEYLITNILMIYDQVKNKEKIKFFPIFVDLNKDDVSKVKKLIKILDLDKNTEINFVNVNPDERIESKISHISYATNIRILIPDILKNVDNVLYLDNDIVVEGDLTETLKFFRKNKFYGRRWGYDSWWLNKLASVKMIKNYRYVNAGVLFLDLNIMRENNLIEKMINFEKKNKNFIKFADQDILNCNLEFEDMPYFFNIARKNWFEDYKTLESEIDVKIFHFLSKHKQWNTNEYVQNNNGDLTIEEFEVLAPKKEIWFYYFIIFNNKLENI